MKEDDGPQLPLNEWELEGGKNTSPLQVVPLDIVTDGGTIDPRIIVSINNNEVIVKLGDGSFARVRNPTPMPQLIEGIPRYLPEYLVDWVSRSRENGQFSGKLLDFYLKLATDHRMSDFWSWFSTAKFERSRYLHHAYSVANSIRQSCKIPGKPGDMTPGEREKYFNKVRKHAYALMSLLMGTRYDGGGFEDREISESTLSKPLHELLYHWGEDEHEEGHIVAFRVRPDGMYRSSINYPDGELCSNLVELTEWTHWNDQWDGNIFGTSAPIVQANSESTKLVYFSCTFYDTLKSRGVEIPFSILASVANVALDLSPDDQADEETVRKQVRRYQARRAKEKEQHPFAFEE